MKKIEFMLEKQELEEMFQQDRETYEEVQKDVVFIGGQEWHQTSVFDILMESEPVSEPEEPVPSELPRDIPWSPHDNEVSVELDNNSTNE